LIKNIPFKNQSKLRASLLVKLNASMKCGMNIIKCHAFPRNQISCLTNLTLKSLGDFAKGTISHMLRINHHLLAINQL